MPGPKLNFTIRKLEGCKDTPENVIEEITKVNCVAFAGDKFNEILLGGHWDLAHYMQRAFVIDSLMGGYVYVVEVDNKLVASALWHGPGQALLKAEGSAEAGFNKFMAVLTQRDPDVAKWWTEYYLGKYTSFTTDCLNGPDFKRDGWLLQVIGVLPEYQRRGIGSALIKVVEDQIASDPNVGPAGRKMSLETEMEGSREFYRKIGFIERGETVIEGCGKMGSCPMWCFAKEL